MASGLAILTLEGASTAALAGLSATALDRPLAARGELIVATAATEAVLLGALQRRCETRAGEVPIFARGSGGAAVRVGAGTVWVQLALEEPSAFVPCDASRLVNRYVRPLLAAIVTPAGAARYFGRDFISLASRPIGVVGFAHDAASGRAFFEALVAVRGELAVDPARSSFMGRAPASIADLAPDASSPSALAARIATRYASAFGEGSSLEPPEVRHASEVPHAPPWTAEAEDAIGRVAAARDPDGALRVGGEWLASRDGVRALEAALADSRAAIDATEAHELAASALTSGGRTVEGLRSFDVLGDVIARASR